MLHIQSSMLVLRLPSFATESLPQSVDFQHTEGSKLLVMNPLMGGPCGPVIHHFLRMRSMQIR